MTISTTTNRYSYSGNGTTTVFSYASKFLANGDVVVVLVSSDGTETVQTLNTHYTVSGAGNDAGGSVTMTTAPASGQTLVIYGDPDIIQPLDLVENDSLPAEEIEDAYDRITLIALRLSDRMDRSLRLSDGDATTEANMVLPNETERASMVLGFDADGDPVAVANVPTSGVTATAAAETLLDDTTISAMRDTLGVFAADWIFAPLYSGVDSTGTNDSSAGIQAAVDAAAGKPVYFPAGTYRIDTTIDYTTTSSDVFTPGLKLIGAGRLLTFFDNRVASGACFKIDTDTTVKFQAGIEFRGFSIITDTSPASSDGIYLRRAYHVSIHDVSIKGMSQDGIHIEVNEGDGDGSNMVAMSHVRIENCAAWGINCAMGTGLNELSFLKLDHVFVQSCGTASASSPPPSGGMKWRGQVLDLDNSAFVTCENVGLYVVGGAGLGNTLSVDATAFENNVKRHVLIEGLDSGALRNIQLYSNDSYVATNGIKLDGTSSTIRNILIDGVLVRATSGNNAYTAFQTTGGSVENASIQVTNVSWGNFDHSGQTRYDGSFIRDEIQDWPGGGPELTFATPGNLAVTYSSRVGKYIKGRDGVTRCWFNITTSAFTHTTASGQLRIGNLPRTAENTAGMISVGSVQWQGITKASYTQVTPKIEPNTAYIQFQASGSGQALSDVSAADMPTGGNVALIGMIEFRGAT